MALVFGLPLVAVVVVFGWGEVTRLRAIQSIGLAAIEAEKQVKIARAQAAGRRALTDAETEAGHG